MTDKLSVLRACHRALEPGGIIAGTLIHTPTGLTADELALAAEAGPVAVGSERSPSELLVRAGFAAIVHRDVTPRWRSVLEARVAAQRRAIESAPGAAGSALAEDLAKSERYLEAIGRGLLLRALVVAKRPARPLDDEDPSRRALRAPSDRPPTARSPRRVGSTPASSRP